MSRDDTRQPPTISPLAPGKPPSRPPTSTFDIPPRHLRRRTHRRASGPRRGPRSRPAPSRHGKTRSLRSSYLPTALRFLVRCTGGSWIHGQKSPTGPAHPARRLNRGAAHAHSGIGPPARSGRYGPARALHGRFLPSRLRFMEYSPRSGWAGTILMDGIERRNGGIIFRYQQPFRA